jgi:hypothetical protein
MGTEINRFLMICDRCKYSGTVRGKSILKDARLPGKQSNLRESEEDTKSRRRSCGFFGKGGRIDI